MEHLWWLLLFYLCEAWFIVKSQYHLLKTKYVQFKNKNNPKKKKNAATYSQECLKNPVPNILEIMCKNLLGQILHSECF